MTLCLILEEEAVFFGHNVSYWLVVGLWYII